MLKVIAAQSLRGPAFLDHKLKRIVLVDRYLFVLEKLQEAIVGHVLDVCVGATTKENRQADQGEGDGDQNDAAPVKTGLVPAGFILILGVAIRLRHKAWSALLTNAKRLT